jgi:hypothetical protein
MRVNIRFILGICWQENTLRKVNYTKKPIWEQESIFPGGELLGGDKRRSWKMR